MPTEPTMPLYPRGPWAEEEGAGQSWTPEAKGLSEQLLQDTRRLTHRLSFGPRHAWVAPGTLGTLSGEKNDSDGSCKARFMIPSLTPSPDFTRLLCVPISWEGLRPRARDTCARITQRDSGTTWASAQPADRLGSVPQFPTVSFSLPLPWAQASLLQVRGWSRGMTPLRSPRTRGGGPRASVPYRWSRDALLSGSTHISFGTLRGRTE